MMSRPLVRVPVPPGPEGPARLLPAISAALDGSGPAFAAIPTVSATVSNDYVMSVLAAVRAENGDPPLESEDVVAVVPTSGSTGSPRGVLLTRSQLTSMTEAINGPGARPQWIAALPVTSMGGINVLVRALASGHDPIPMASIGGAGPFTVEGFAETVAAAARVTDDVRVSLVPGQVARLLSDDRGIDALRRCTSILVGGAALRPSLREGAGDLGIPLTTTYGATETAGGCVLDGTPLPGVRVTAAGSPGLLTISGPCVALGYRCDPDATRSVFTPSGFITPDIGEVSADGSVTVVGRADDIVIVNGINVSPLAVERVLSDLPDVVAAAAVAVGAPADTELHAFLEVRDGAPEVEDAARAAVTRRLGRVARPAIHRVERLPHLPNGKVDRLLLRQWAGDLGKAD